LVVFCTLSFFPLFSILYTFFIVYLFENKVFKQNLQEGLEISPEDVHKVLARANLSSLLVTNL